MREITGNLEYKNILLNMLLYFCSLCKKHGIRYFLYYGSLIGAVRHNGFIPWDDDIDIAIPRKDFLKLLDVMEKEEGQYTILSIYNIEEFNAPLAKIIDKNTLLVQEYGYIEKVQLGVYLDLFILDGLPQDNPEKYLETAFDYKRKWTAADHVFRYKDSTIVKDILRYIKYLPSHILGYKYYNKLLDDYSMKFEFDKSNYVSNLTYLVYGNELLHREDFEQRYVSFEGVECSIPVGYERILTTIYGEWRILPPLEKRVNRHSFKCYIVKEEKLRS